MEKEIIDTLVGLETEKLQQANISILLKSYDEIFSQFDPRPYLERSISEDFLRECKRAIRLKKGEGVELSILIPKERRNVREEWRIKKRLKDHFLNHYHEEKKEIKKVIKEGILWNILGAIFILTVSWIHTKYPEPGFLLNVISTMLEPAGWFSFWEGLGKIFISTKEEGDDYKFYKKMAEVEINFSEY